MSSGLIITAIVAWNEGDMSLYDGLAVSMVRCTFPFSLVIMYSLLYIAHDNYDGICDRQLALRLSLIRSLVLSNA